MDFPEGVFVGKSMAHFINKRRPSTPSQQSNSEVGHHQFFQELTTPSHSNRKYATSKQKERDPSNCTPPFHHKMFAIMYMQPSNYYSDACVQGPNRIYPPAYNMIYLFSWDGLVGVPTAYCLPIQNVIRAPSPRPIENRRKVKSRSNTA